MNGIKFLAMLVIGVAFIAGLRAGGAGVVDDRGLVTITTTGQPGCFITPRLRKPEEFVYTKVYDPLEPNTTQQYDFRGYGEILVGIIITKKLEHPFYISLTQPHAQHFNVNCTASGPIVS